MALDWVILANTVTVIGPVLVMLVTYVRSQSKFEITISTLTEAVKKLSSLVDRLSDEQHNIIQRIIRLETHEERTAARLDKLESREVLHNERDSI